MYFSSSSSNYFECTVKAEVREEHTKRTHRGTYSFRCCLICFLVCLRVCVSMRDVVIIYVVVAAAHWKEGDG